MPQSMDDSSIVHADYDTVGVIGHGTFGSVVLAKIRQTGQVVAIKRVVCDERLHNRELQIMTHFLTFNATECPNVVHLIDFNTEFISDHQYLSIVMEYVPFDTHRYHKQWLKKTGTRLPLNVVKVWLAQLCRALAYLHHPNRGICHRDIKPHNILVDPATQLLKLCDFGSAKQLISGQSNVAYVCSRFYRAPELLFGSLKYGVEVDMWAVGCVLAEWLLGEILFRGASTIDQIAEIFKLLGTPSSEDVAAVHPQYGSFAIINVDATPLRSVFPEEVPDSGIDLLNSLICFHPHHRMSAADVLRHPFLASLREVDAMLPDGKPIPSELFNFSTAERKELPEDITAMWTSVW